MLPYRHNTVEVPIFTSKGLYLSKHRCDSIRKGLRNHFFLTNVYEGSGISNEVFRQLQCTEGDLIQYGYSRNIMYMPTVCKTYCYILHSLTKRNGCNGVFLFRISTARAFARSQIQFSFLLSKFRSIHSTIQPKL